ncbi:MAG: purine-nucleoside phosphorylase [Gemmatimonadales bacterium]
MTSAIARLPEVEEAAEAVRKRLGSRRPLAAVVLGSGLGSFSDRVANAITIPYREIPGFPVPTVEGHAGELVAGTLSGKMVLLQSGRFHLYEGHPAQTAAFAVRVFASLGIGTLILTNAAGGIRRGLAAGSVMMITDHLNLSFHNPLTGPVLPGEERFPDMSEPYDPALRRLARDVAIRERVALAEGVYVQLLGPSYETPAEIRMLERLGADAVGMSTVIEVVAARARGMRCLGFSAVTNAAAGVLPVKLNHVEVMETARRVAGDLGTIISGVVAAL